MITSDFLEFSVKDKIGRLVLNRPPVNALNAQLIADLTEFSKRLSAEIEQGRQDVRSLVISSALKHFCAGADLKERRELPEHQVEAAVQKTRNMASAIAAIPVPTIAAVNGSALGGGMELALAADMRVVAESAKLGLRETALAIIPGAGGTQRLPRLIGPSKAIYWITSARIFSAEECLRDGVANEVCPDEKLLDRALEIAAEIAQNGPVAVRAAKDAILRGLELPMHEALEIERQGYAKIIPTQDRIEALNAFREKCTPVFEGR